MLDIDWFKPDNDHYGHQAGDECLRRVARAMRATLARPTDLIARRYGGEEFIVLLPHTDAIGVATVGKRLRSTVHELGIEARSSPAGTITISVGGATWLPETGELHISELLGRADAALYEAKRLGRNRAEFRTAPEIMSTTGS